MAVGIRHADHMAPSIRKKLALTSLISGGRSVGMVRLRTEAMEFFFYYYYCPVLIWGAPSLLSDGHWKLLPLAVKQPGLEAIHSPIPLHGIVHNYLSPGTTLLCFI
jgi:hypothetical protein